MPVILRSAVRGFSRRRLVGDVGRALERLGLAAAELSVCVVSGRKMVEANRRFFNRSEPTDVIAVSQVEGEVLAQPERLLGDVIVSIDAARRQAREEGHSLSRELSILAVHGLLHTLGMDDRTSAERRAMMTRTLRLLGPGR